MPSRTTQRHKARSKILKTGKFRTTLNKLSHNRVPKKCSFKEKTSPPTGYEKNLNLVNLTLILRPEGVSQWSSQHSHFGPFRYANPRVIGTDGQELLKQQQLRLLPSASCEDQTGGVQSFLLKLFLQQRPCTATGHRLITQTHSTLGVLHAPKQL